MYAKYFNKKYNYIGHLFQDRYHAEYIESDDQMLEASTYENRNYKAALKWWRKYNSRV